MITYIMAFIFYTLAMVGILLIGFIVYKKTIINTKSDKKSSMAILDSLQIAPKKQLLIVKIKNEKFLIASGLEHTTFLAKLEDNQKSYSINETIKQPQISAIVEQNLNTQNAQNYQNTQNYQAYQNNQNNQYEQIEKPDQKSEEEAFLAQRHYNLQQARLEKIQKQFRELYENEPQKVVQAQEIEEKPLNRKAMIRQLLKDLNETTSSKVGNGF